jgi:transcriptional regulator with XRE-family HTH domain
MVERIKLLLKAQNLTVTQFAEAIKFSNSAMSHVINGRNNPSLEFVTNTLLAYPNLSSDWLLFGTGAMWRNTTNGNNDFSVPPLTQKKTEPELFDDDEYDELEDKMPNPSISQDLNIHAKNTTEEKISNSRELEDKSEVPVEKPPQRSNIIENSDSIEQIIVFFNDNKYRTFK